MPAEAVERRLAAILAADIAGYSRLVGRDRRRDACVPENDAPRDYRSADLSHREYRDTYRR